MSHIDKAFDKLKSNLEITKTEKDLAKKRHKLIRGHIASAWQRSYDFLTGSYDRQTMTKKLKDVDIFVVINRDGHQGALADGPGLSAISALGACCKSVNCGVKGHSAHRYGPKMRCCARWRPDFCHFEGFRLPIRWISRAVGLLQQACM